MYFLNLWYLWFLPALAIPFLLNILKNRKIKHIEFPYYELLFNSKIKNLAHFKIVNYLLLFLRLSIIAVIIFFMARPVFVTKYADGKVIEDIPTVFIIDNSQSMSYLNGSISLLNSALVLAEKSILSLNKNISCALIYMNRYGNVEIMESYSNPEKLLNVLRNLKVQNHKFDVAQSIQMAVSYLQAVKSSAGKIVVLTDNQKHNWYEFQKPSVDKKININFIYPKGISIKTAGIVGFKFPQRLPLRGDKSFVAVTLKNFSDVEWENVNLKFFMEDELMDKTSVTLKPGQVLDHIFYYRCDQSKKFLKGIVKFECPDFSIDNNICIVFPSYYPDDIYLIGDNQMNLFLKYGLLTYIKDPGSFINECGIDSLGSIKSGVIIFNNYIDSETSAIQLKNFVAGGNCAVVFYTSVKDDKNSRQIAVAGCDMENPLFHPYKQMGGGVFSQIQFEAGKSERLFPELEQRSVLMKSADGIPFLEEISLGKGKIFVFYADSSGELSNFVKTGVFVPLLHRIMDRIITLRNGDIQYYNRDMSMGLDLSSDSRFSIQWITPSNQVFSPDSVFISGCYRIDNLPFDNPGFYTLKNGSGEKIFACNISAYEGDMTFIDENELTNIFADNKVSFSNLLENSNNVLTQNAQGSAIFIFICLLLCIVELLIANLAG